MKEAYLYMEMGEGKVACGVCPRHCMIPENFVGFCRMYVNLKGTLYSLNYGKISSYTMDPIEKKPLYHFAPGTDVFSVGTWGCNFHCKGCQNSAIACIDRAEESVEMTPEELVEAAKVLGINLYACEMAMHVLGLKKDDFISEVKDVLGVASFLQLSEGGQTLFI